MIVKVRLAKRLLASSWHWLNDHDAVDTIQATDDKEVPVNLKLSIVAVHG
jgi:hypothetical protein